MCSTPADSGDGIAVLAAGGGVIGRIEWDSDLHTLVDGAGARVTAMSLQGAKFRKDPARPRAIAYRFATDDRFGNLVDIESSAALRN